MINLTVTGFADAVSLSFQRVLHGKRNEKKNNRVWPKLLQEGIFFLSIYIPDIVVLI